MQCSLSVVRPRPGSSAGVFKRQVVAHDNSDTEQPACSAGYETALHFLAKRIIARCTRIKLPGGKFFEYHQATVERWADRFRVDIYPLNTISRQTLLVEVVVGRPA